MKQLIAISSLLFLLLSCVSNNLNEAAVIVANEWQAEESSIEYSKEADTKTGLKNVIKLNLKNLATVDSSYFHNNITSTSAIMLFLNLEPKDLVDLEGVTVLVENHGDKYEKSYSIQSLMQALELLQLTDAFFDSQKAQDEIDFVSLFDSSFVSDSIAHDIYKFMGELSLKYGEIKSRKVLGFDFDTIKNTKQDVFVVSEQIENGQSLTTYKFYISIESSKIIYIGINE